MSKTPKTGYWVAIILLAVLLAGSVMANFGLLAFCFGGGAVGI